MCFIHGGKEWVKLFCMETYLACALSLEPFHTEEEVSGS